MKVILLKDYKKIGKRGDLKEVSDGLARNMLIPQGIAKQASPEMQKTILKEEVDAREKIERDEKRAMNFKKDIENKIFTVKVKVGSKGQTFGSVKEQVIIDEINRKLGSHFDKKQVQGANQLKQIGTYEVTVSLSSGIKARAKLNIEPLT